MTLRIELRVYLETKLNTLSIQAISIKKLKIQTGESPRRFSCFFVYNYLNMNQNQLKQPIRANIAETPIHADEKITVKKVVALPIEATAIGNLKVQMNRK